jgi:hypothetical protein
MWILCAEIDDGSGTSIFIYWTGTGISFKKDQAKKYVKHDAAESRCRTINMNNGGGKVQVAGSDITVKFKIEYGE